MNKKFGLFILIFLFSLSLISPNFSYPLVINENKPSKILVRFKRGISPEKSYRALRAIIPEKTAGEKILRLRSTEIEVLSFPDEKSAERAIHKLKSSPLIDIAEKNFKMRFTGKKITVNDPEFSQQWGLKNRGQEINGLTGTVSGLKKADIHINNAWKRTTGKKKIKIALIDTGMDFTHPDLKANLWTNKGEVAGNFKDDDGNGYVDDINGWDFVNDDNDPSDDIQFFSHGTNGAGIIAATTNNKTGIAGINRKARLMILKISPTLDEAVEAIEYAINKKVNIINASFGDNKSSEIMRAAIKTAKKNNILFVASVDDSSYDTDSNPFYPASYDLPNIISVTSTDINDGLSFFAAYGKTSVHIGAPGDDIITTSSESLTGKLYEYVQGTSFATNFVTGVAALIISVKPKIKVKKLRKIILENSDKLDSLTEKTASGGRLNAAKAVKATIRGN